MTVPNIAEAAAGTEPTPATAGTITESPAATPAPTPATTAPTDMGTADELAKWKAHSRKHEEANTRLSKEIEALRAERMTDSEKAIAEAEKRGRESMAKELGTQIAEAKLRSAAAGKVADVDALLELVDVARFVTAEGVDDNAIAATVERFTKVAPVQAPPKFGSVELGPQGDRPRQLGEAELARMTPEQKVEARRNGQLDELMGYTS